MGLARALAVESHLPDQLERPLPPMCCHLGAGAGTVPHTFPASHLPQLSSRGAGVNELGPHSTRATAADVDLLDAPEGLRKRVLDAGSTSLPHASTSILGARGR
ncbi:hypothetical protein AURDEDRAFT_161395 [Auricularia subglabra TFB-10046 SS5]|nr:hypothetical protein AURDEDRAFT_161395 [Auricularia subglabra TFB-10046 SS5]